MTPDVPALPSDRVNTSPAASSPTRPLTADDLLARVVAASDLDRRELGRCAAGMLDAFAASGLSRHERALAASPAQRQNHAAGQAARGSGALPGFVDVIIEMGYYSHPDDLDRRRRLVAFSRHEQTPRHLLIELQADGADYVVLQSGVEAAFGESWQVVLDILTTTYSKRRGKKSWTAGQPTTTSRIRPPCGAG